MQGRTWDRWRRVGYMVWPVRWLREVYRAADHLFFRLWWAAYTLTGKLDGWGDRLDADADRRHAALVARRRR